MIVVTSSADSGAGTLRQALLDAVADEEITFAVASVNLTSAELTIAQNQTLTGPGSASLTVHRASGGFRVFNVTAGIVSISGMLIRDGLAADGAGINNATTLTLTDVILTENGASNNGGGIYNTGTLTMADCNVFNNTAIAQGGGIWSNNTLIATNLELTGNTSFADGGGIWATTTFRVIGGLISGNGNPGSGGSGGGIWNNSSLELTEVTISLNAADTTDGDAIFNGNAVLLRRCTVSGHTNPGSSAIYNNGGTVLVENSTISGNTDEEAIRNNLGSVDLKNSTVTANGTGVFQVSGSILILFDTILCGNLTQDLTSDAIDVVSNGNNILGTYSNAITPGPDDQISVLIGAVALGPLQDNGGPTFTHALLTGSVAIDAGNSAAAPPTDQRGAGFPRVINGTIDIGAFESPAACLTFTGTLPGWLTIQDDCLVVTPGSFRGTTKAEANASAQAALDAFVTESLANGDLVCGSAEDCAAPLFARVEYTGEIESPGQTVDFTFEATLGMNVALWNYVATFNPKLTLFDPSMNQIGQDSGDAGYYANSNFGAGLTQALPATGTYTARVESSGGFATGAFQLVVSDGVEAIISGLGSPWVSIYVESTKKIFVLSGYDGAIATAHVIDAPTHTLVNSVVLVTMPDDSFAPARPVLFYNPNDDSVWACTMDPDSADRLYHRLNPTTGAILETIPLASGATYFAAFMPGLNKIYGYEGSAGSAITVFNCATKVYDASLPTDGGPFTSITCRYLPQINQILVVENDVRFQMINSLGVMGSGIAVVLSHNGFYQDGLYYTCKNTIPRGLRAIDLTTGTVVKTNQDDYRHYGLDCIAFNPCRNCLMTGVDNGGSPTPYMAVSLTLDYEATESVIAISTATTMITLWAHFVWNPDTSRMFFILGGGTPVVGSAYVLS